MQLHFHCCRHAATHHFVPFPQTGAPKCALEKAFAVCGWATPGRLPSVWQEAQMLFSRLAPGLLDLLTAFQLKG